MHSDQYPSQQNTNNTQCHKQNHDIMLFIISFSVDEVHLSHKTEENHH